MRNIGRWVEILRVADGIKNATASQEPLYACDAYLTAKSIVQMVAKELIKEGFPCETKDVNGVPTVLIETDGVVYSFERLASSENEWKEEVVEQPIDIEDESSSRFEDVIRNNEGENKEGPVDADRTETESSADTSNEGKEKGIKVTKDFVQSMRELRQSYINHQQMIVASTLLAAANEQGKTDDSQEDDGQQDIVVTTEDVLEVTVDLLHDAERMPTSTVAEPESEDTTTHGLEVQIENVNSSDEERSTAEAEEEEENANQLNAVDDEGSDNKKPSDHSQNDGRLTNQADMNQETSDPRYRESEKPILEDDDNTGAGFIPVDKKSLFASLGEDAKDVDEEDCSQTASDVSSVDNPNDTGSRSSDQDADNDSSNEDTEEDDELSALNVNDILLDYVSVEVMHNRHKLYAEMVVTPMNFNGSCDRLMVWVSDDTGIHTYAGIALEVVVCGIKIRLTGKSENNEFQCHIQDIEAVDGQPYSFEMHIERHGSHGHSVVNDDGIAVHVVPLAYHNMVDGDAVFYYVIDREDGSVETGYRYDGDKALFEFADQTFRIRARWTEDSNVAKDADGKEGSDEKRFYVLCEPVAS